jgi:hypothetical protein
MSERGKALFFLWLIVVSVGGICPREVQADSDSYLPGHSELKGWTLDDSPQRAEGEQLFVLINGGAEIYLEYGFKSAVLASYRNEKGKTISVEIYEMTDSSGAFGVYGFKTGDEGKEVSIGNQGQVEEYFLNFWKGSFLVTVSGPDSSDETIEALTSIAKTIEAKIKVSGEKPLFLDVLPLENLDRRSIKYIRGPLGLMKNGEFGTENIFGVKEGIIASYGEHKAYVFKYRDSAESREWFLKAQMHFTRNSGYENRDQEFLALGEEKRYLHAFLVGKHLVLVTGKEKKDGEGLAKKIKERL